MVALALLMLAAPPKPPSPSDAQRAFDRLKSLDGSWSVLEEGKTFEGRFEILSRGTAVEQRSGFTAVYYLNGDSLMMTLFPDDGNQPRFLSAGLHGSTIEFRFVDITNLAVGAGYMRALRIDFPSADRMVQTWTWHDKDGDQVLPIAFTRKPRGK